MVSRTLLQQHIFSEFVLAYELVFKKDEEHSINIHVQVHSHIVLEIPLHSIPLFGGCRGCTALSSTEFSEAIMHVSCKEYLYTAELA